MIETKPCSACSRCARHRSDAAFISVQASGYVNNATAPCVNILADAGGGRNCRAAEGSSVPGRADGAEIIDIKKGAAGRALLFAPQYFCGT
jgi:hypothetical protein